MSKQFYKITIDDVQYENCTNVNIERLLDIFERTVLKLATTLAYYAQYRLADFTTAKQYNLEHFTLTLEKHIICGQEQWWGKFEHGSQNISIIATLEAP